jgi:hypothetical protein
LAVGNVRVGDNSDISAKYVESINEMSHVLANRMSVTVESRIPNDAWLALYVLVLLGMASVGSYGIRLTTCRVLPAPPWTEVRAQAQSQKPYRV